MDKVIPLDLVRLFFGEQPPLYLAEIVLRTVLIYGFAVVLLRYMGKRGRREMSPFEYLVIIALGSATGDAMFYPEVPIFYAWLVITLVVLLNRLVSLLQFRHTAFHKYVEGEPTLLVKDGQPLERNLARERMTHDELFSMLREGGYRDTRRVALAYLELSGELSVIEAEGDETFGGVYTLQDDSREITT